MFSEISLQDTRKQKQKKQIINTGKGEAEVGRGLKFLPIRRRKLSLSLC